MIPCGRLRLVWAIAAEMSCAAASMSRSRANWMTICVCPRLDVDVMLSMPAIVENCFSSGVATVAAMVCGLVPGNVALTVTVGKSTFGRSLTGNCRYATMPKTRMPIMTSVVMTGRLMNSVVKFIDYLGIRLEMFVLEQAWSNGLALEATECADSTETARKKTRK